METEGLDPEYAKGTASLLRQLYPARLNSSLKQHPAFIELTQFLSQNGKAAFKQIKDGLKASLQLADNAPINQEPEHLTKLRDLLNNIQPTGLSQQDSISLAKQYIIENAQALIQLDKKLVNEELTYSSRVSPMGHAQVPPHQSPLQSLDKVMHDVTQLEDQLRPLFKAAKEQAGERKLAIMLGEAHYFVAPLLVKHIALKLAEEIMPGATVMVELDKGEYEKMTREAAIVHPETALYYQSDHPYVHSRATDHLNMIGLVKHLQESGFKVETPDYSDDDIIARKQALKELPENATKGNDWLDDQITTEREARMEHAIRGVDAALFIGESHELPLMGRLEAAAFHAVGFNTTKLFDNQSLAIVPVTDHKSGYRRFDLQTPDEWNALTPKEVTQVVEHILNPITRVVGAQQTQSATANSSNMPQSVRDAAAEIIETLAQSFQGATVATQGQAQTQQKLPAPVQTAARRS